MAVKQITNEDLFRLENKITETQAQLRHWDRAKMQEKYVEFDNLRETTIVLSKSYEFMNKEIQEIKQIAKEWFLGINAKFDQLPKDFVSRIEFNNQVEKIEIINSIVYWAAKIIVWAVLLSLLWLVIYAWQKTWIKL